MTTPRVEIDVEDVSGTPGSPSEAEFRRWAAAAFADRRIEAEVSIRIVGETEGAELNARYRGKTGPTNVLSFPAELPAGVPLPTVGDLVICAPVVTREAHAQGKQPSAHWAHLTVHGCLHLIGYDHEQEAEAAEMEALETDILARLGFPDPYTSR
jgi:probable rRNA maturation factor